MRQCEREGGKAGRREGCEEGQGERGAEGEWKGEGWPRAATGGCPVEVVDSTSKPETQQHNNQQLTESIAQNLQLVSNN